MSKAAILIDGGYLLKRLSAVRADIESTDPEEVGRAINQLVWGHLNQLNEVHQAPGPLRLLFRTFYYDARPYQNKGHTPVDRRAIDYGRTPEAQFRDRLHDILRRMPNLALRFGEVWKDTDRSWILRPQPQKRLLDGELAAADLVDADFAPALRQKGVDMRIGLDIASIALKRQAETIVLVSGDADFVPAAKLARREGVQFVLDPLWRSVSPDLLEHIDGLRSGFFRP